MIVTKNIPYIEGATDNAHMLDIYAPDFAAQPEGAPQPKDSASDVTEDAFPVLIFIHGGGWIRGDKRNTDEDSVRSYTDNGIIVITLNYRLAGNKSAPFPAFMDDIAAALFWVKNNIAAYHGSPEKIIVSGHSAGAHMVALLACAPVYLNNVQLSPKDIKAFIPVDTASYDVTQRLNKNGEGRLINFMRSRAFGDNEDVLAKASPLKHVTAQNAHQTPIDIFTTTERPIAIAASEEFYNALSQKGYHSSIKILDNNLDHAAMRNEIFREGSPIFEKIISYAQN